MQAISHEEAARRLHGEIRRFRTDTALALIRGLDIIFSSDAAITDLPSAIRRLWPVVINRHQLAYLAKALIDLSNDHRNEEMNLDQYVVYANYYNQAQGIDAPEGNDIPAWERFFLRTSYQQFPHQMASWGNLPRTLVLFDRLAAEPRFTRHFDMHAALQETLHMSLQRFLGVGLWVFLVRGTTRQQPPFFSEAEFLGTGRAIASDEEIASFFDLTTASYEELRRRGRELATTDEQHRFYSFNPLEIRPIVRTQRSGLILPLPGLLLDRLTHGVYHDLLPKFGSTFTECLGHIYETYVGEVLRAAYDEKHLMSEVSYGPRRRSDLKSSDWTIIEGDVATLLECKVTRLTLPSRMSADPVELRDDLVKSIVKGLRQLHRVIRDIRSGERGLERLHGMKELVPVVLLLDRFFLANAQEIQRIVGEELEHLGIEQFDYQVICIEELEPAVQLLRREGLGQLLLKKMSDRSNPFQSTAFIPFDSYLGTVYPNDAKEPHPLLRKVRREFLEWFFPFFPALDSKGIDLFLEP